MRPFRFVRPEDAAAAVALVATEPNAAFHAGGTNLVDHLKLGVATPDLLVDIRRFASHEITDADDGGLVIGAGVTNSELAADPRVRERWPGLAQSLLAGASAQLRNAATVGGNPLQRTRCVYFQDITSPCNKRTPGSGCAAIGGYTRYHAILGVDGGRRDDPRTCIATHPSDFAVALTAFDAEVEVLGPEGSRRLPFRDLHRSVGDDPSRDTVLEHGELITAIRLPAPPPGARSAYRKVRDRASYAFALVSVAAVVTVEADGRLGDIRLALGGVAHRPWRASGAEAVLRGARPDPELFREAARGELAAAVAQPGVGGGNGFKIPLATRTIVATLRDLTGDAGGAR